MKMKINCISERDGERGIIACSVLVLTVSVRMTQTETGGQGKWSASFCAQTTVGVVLKSWQGAGLQGVEEFTKTEASQLSSTVKRKRIEIMLLKTAMWTQLSLPMSCEPIMLQ